MDVSCQAAVECGENIYLAGLNEDGTHHQTKYLRREDYLPVGSIVHMEGRKFRVDKVDFDKDSVTLQDMALAELRMPIFREAPLAVVRELYEQEPEPPVLGSDGLGLPGEDSNKLPVSIEANEVPTTPEAAAAEEGLNEEGAPELAEFVLRMRNSAQAVPNRSSPGISKPSKRCSLWNRSTAVRLPKNSRCFRSMLAGAVWRMPLTRTRAVGQRSTPN